MLSQTEAEARVQRGIEYLDRTEPGWAARINLETFCIETPCRCVWGQLRGGYSNRPDCVDRDAAEGFGFDIDGEREEWELLDDTWIAAIRALQSPVERDVTRSGAVAAELAMAK